MIMAKVWPLVLIFGFGIATFIFGLIVQKNMFDLVSTAALVSTLVAVILSPIETRMLRVQQELDSEIRFHPWLKGSSLNVIWDKDGGYFLDRTSSICRSLMWGSPLLKTYVLMFGGR